MQASNNLLERYDGLCMLLPSSIRAGQLRAELSAGPDLGRNTNDTDRRMYFVSAHELDCPRSVSTGGWQSYHCLEPIGGVTSDQKAQDDGRSEASAVDSDNTWRATEGSQPSDHMHCESVLQTIGAMPSRRSAKNGMPQPAPITAPPVTAAGCAHGNQDTQTRLEPVTAVVEKSPSAGAGPQQQRRGRSGGNPMATTVQRPQVPSQTAGEAAARREPASVMMRLHQIIDEQGALEGGSSDDEDDRPQIVPSLLDRIVAAHSTVSRCPPKDEPPVCDGDERASDTAEHDSDAEEDSIAAAAARVSAAPDANIQLRANSTPAGEEPAQQTSGSISDATRETPPAAASEMPVLRSRPASRLGQHRRSPTRGGPGSVVIHEADAARDAVRRGITTEVRERFNSTSSMSADVAPPETHDHGAAVLAASPAAAPGQDCLGELTSKPDRNLDSKPDHLVRRQYSG